MISTLYMTSKISISFDASYGQIDNWDDLDNNIKKVLSNTLSYEDNTIAYNNKFGSKYKKYKDPRVSLMNNGKFYTGLLSRVKSILDKYQYECSFKNNISKVEPNNNIIYPDWFYEHQIDINKKALRYKRGVCQSPTGSGKSMAMAYIAKSFDNQTILFTVPEIGLLEQLHKSLEQVLDETVGKVYGKKKEFKRVTVGVINSLSNIAKDPEKRDIYKKVNVLICDEAHRVGSNFYRDLCLACNNALYKLGFSATPWRKQGDSLVMEGLLGPVFIKVSSSYLVEKGILAKPMYYSVIYNTPDFTYKKYDPITQGYRTANNKPIRQEVYNKAIRYNQERNNLIAQITANYLNSNNKFPCLVLIENRDQGEDLQRKLGNLGLDIPFVSGTDKSSRRDEIANQLSDFSLKGAIASRIFNEGRDIPPLGLVIIAGGGADTKTHLQQIGRVIRRFEGKQCGIIVDINDSEPYYLSYNSKTRIKAVKDNYNNSVYKVSQEQILHMSSLGFTE